MTQALQQLKDIHLPKAISMWGIAPGWIMLYIIGTGLIVYGIFSWYRRKKRRYTIKFATRELNQLQKLSQDNPDNINIAAEISILIRRTALHYFARHTVAGLSGPAWLNFLNQSGKTTQFTTEIGQLLIDAPYRPYHNADLTSLFVLTRQWLAVVAKMKRKEI